MAWYAAHAIMYVKFADGNQDKYPIWENIILIEANFDEEALDKAQKRAKEDESQSEDDFTWEERSASLIFAGIRKLISCNSLKEKPCHGTEVSYSQMEVDSKDALLKLAQGEPVIVKYEE